jgi:gliding motility-associated-like protein
MTIATHFTRIEKVASKVLFVLLWLLVAGSARFARAQEVSRVAGSVLSGAVDGGALTVAQFNNPHGIAIDRQGNVYVADRFNHLIRKITPDSVVTTLAGNGTIGAQDGKGAAATFHEPWGLCVDKNGVVYVADTRNNLIRKILPDGTVTTWAGSGNFGTTNGVGAAATFGNPTGIEIDALGNLYVADHLTHIIRKISPTRSVTTVAGKAYIEGFADGIGTAAIFDRPYGLHIDNNGNILIADELNHRIRKMTPAGVVTTVAGSGILGNKDSTALQARFNYPWDMTTDTLNNIYVGDGYNNVIRKISPQGNVTTYAGTGTTGAYDGPAMQATFNAITGIAFSPATRELYVADCYNNMVRKIVDANLGMTVAAVVDAPTVGGNSPTICVGDTVRFHAFPSTFDLYQLFINNTAQPIGTTPAFAISNLSIGTHTITIKATNVNGSITSNTIMVTVVGLPTATIQTLGATTFYAGDSCTLIAGGTGAYLWSTGATTQTIVVFAAGSYTVQVMNAGGCAAVSSPVTITVNAMPQAPTITNVPTTALCFTQSYTLASSYPTGNQWYLNDTPIAGATATTYVVTTAGSYKVEHTMQPSGLILTSAAANITYKPRLIKDFVATPTTVHLPMAQISLTASLNGVGKDYDWTFGDDKTSTLAAPTHIYTTAGVYTLGLTVSDAQGCRDTLTKTAYIRILDPLDPNTAETADVFIPTAFSPNGDGANDVFFVRGDGLTKFSMQIYNVWGEQLFAATDQAIGWDGTHNGSCVQSGAYVYVTTFVNAAGKRKTVTGTVNVLQ